MRLPLLLSAALLATLPALAADRAESPSRMSTAPSIGNMDTPQFLAFHADVRRDVEAGKYRDLSARDVATINAQEDLIDSRLHDGKTFDELSERARLDVFNAHERIVAMINGDAEQRLVCRKEHQVGTHKPRVVCLSEHDRDLAAQQNQLRNIHKDASLD